MKVFIFLLTCFLSLFIFFGLVSYNLEDICRLRGGDVGLVCLEKVQFQNRDFSMPAVVFLGGSDVREAFDHQWAKKYFGDRGYGFYNFGHSSSGDSFREQMQILTSLKLSSRDIVFVSFFQNHFVRNEAPVISALWKSLTSEMFFYQINSITLNLDDKLSLYITDKFEIFKYLPLFQHIFKGWSFEKKDLSALRGVYGDSPEDVSIQQKKVLHYKDKLIGGHYSEINYNRRLELISSLQKFTVSKILFYEVPRNPMYTSITDKSFIEKVKQVKSKYAVIELSEHVDLKNTDFFDFDHLNSVGRVKLTKVAIPYLFNNYVRIE